MLLSKIFPLISLAFLCSTGIFLFIALKHKKHIFKLQETLQKMKKVFNDLDAQAKLIIKTDLELNKTQEELDKRLKGLDTLQKTTRLISTTLDEKEIFYRLSISFMSDLGFEKSLTCLFDPQSNPIEKISAGFSPEDREFILKNFLTEETLISPIKEGKTISSLNASKKQEEFILRLFATNHFVLTPILTQNGATGFIFIGNHSDITSITEGDEEIVSILASQLGQSLENARNFEREFSSKNILESTVTDRTQQLTSALEEVQTINKAKSDFISAVSHELRTPLTSIKGYASILIAGKLGEVPQPVKERLEKINYHTDNLVTLINNMLDISRIESKKMEMNLSPNSLEDVLENVGDLLAPQMTEKQINWKVNIPSDFPKIIFDDRQIDRVFINLIGNALKFTPPQGTISVTVEKGKENNALISVTDTGVGIDEESVKRLFEEFYRVDNPINETVKGTGLGLSLVKKIIEAHRGEIWVTSKLNTGTTFHFTLPLNKV